MKSTPHEILDRDVTLLATSQWICIISKRLKKRAREGRCKRETARMHAVIK